MSSEQPFSYCLQVLKVRSFFNPILSSSFKDWFLSLIHVIVKMVFYFFPNVIFIRSLAHLVYYYRYTFCEFLTSILADRLSLESEWHQVSAGIQDPSQYSGWSQQCRRLDDLDSSSDFQHFQPPFQDFPKSTNYNWYQRYSLVPKYFSSLARSKYLSLFSFSLIFTLWCARTVKSVQLVLFC